MPNDPPSTATCAARLCQEHPLCRLRYQLDVGGMHYSECDTNSRGGFGDGYPCDCTCEADVRALLAAATPAAAHGLILRADECPSLCAQCGCHDLFDSLNQSFKKLWVGFVIVAIQAVGFLAIAVVEALL